MPNKPTLATASRSPDLSNLRAVYNFLTSGIEKYTNGKGKNLSREAALGLMGNWTHESGDPYLANTARVQEAGGRGPGVGIQQYTEPSRKAAYQSWLNGVGGNPSTLQQAQYAIQEYYGPNRNLIGWTRALENLPKGRTPQQYAQYFSDKLLRPSVPHLDRRMSEAQRLGQMLGGSDNGGGSRVNTPNQQGLYNPPSVGKQGPVFNVDPSKWLNRYKPNASAANPVVVPQFKPQSRPGDLNVGTRSIGNLVKLPGLNDIAQAAIGNYGNRVPGMNTSAINMSAWGSGSPDLGRATGISSSPSYRAVTNSGYTWKDTAPVASAWKRGFGLV